jgi:hypothetical protein
VIAFTSWPWDVVEHQMDLHRLAAMRRHWRRSPPLQAMVQGYLGIEPQEPAAPLSEADEAAALRDFVANFSAAGGTVL